LEECFVNWPRLNAIRGRLYGSKKGFSNRKKILYASEMGFIFRKRVFKSFEGFLMIGEGFLAIGGRDLCNGRSPNAFERSFMP